MCSSMAVLFGYVGRWLIHACLILVGAGAAHRDPAAQRLRSIGFRTVIFQLSHRGMVFGLVKVLSSGWQLHVARFEDGTWDAHVEPATWCVEHALGPRLAGEAMFVALARTADIASPVVRARRPVSGVQTLALGAAATKWTSVTMPRRVCALARLLLREWVGRLHRA